MSPDVIVLGLASVIRPTSMAAVYAFLASRTPSRLLLSYIVAGLAVSLTVGIAAVTVIHVSAPPPSVTGPGRAFVDIVLGLGALAGAVYQARRTPREDAAVDAPPRRPSAMLQRLRSPTVRSAAVAGVLTHLPGVFYLAALAAIVADQAGLVDGLLQVGVYNLLWYAVPLAALTSWTLHPDTTRDRAARLTVWAQSRKKILVVAALSVVGVYLIAVGVSALLTG